MRSYPKIKILHLSSEKTWRGGEQQIAYLIGELDNKGVDNFVLCKTNSAFQEYCNNNGIKYYEAGFNSNIDLKSALTLNTICKKEQPDLIHCHSSRSHSMALYSYFFRSEIPIIVSRRVDFPIKNSWKYNRNSIKRIICVSDFIKNLVIPEIKYPERCITIHSGIDINKFNRPKGSELLKEFGFDSTFKAIGNTSAIADHKDYFTFVETAEYVLQQKENIVFFIAGDGPLKNVIKDYIDSKNLQNRIILLGFRDNIIDLLPEFDCFLMTSKTEGLGTSLLDALACGVPVVATKTGGIPEVIIQSETGLISEVGDFESLGKQVIQILEDSFLAQKLIRGGKKHVQNFSIESTAEKTYTEYLNILGQTIPSKL